MCIYSHFGNILSLNYTIELYYMISTGKWVGLDSCGVMNFYIIQETFSKSWFRIRFFLRWYYSASKKYVVYVLNESWQKHTSTCILT